MTFPSLRAQGQQSAFFLTQEFSVRKHAENPKFWWGLSPLLPLPPFFPYPSSILNSVSQGSPAHVSIMAASW
jgi:hypothetical protein